MTRRCPNCEKPEASEFRPFCSRRCREVDLNRWFTGAYAVPAVELDEPEMEALNTALNSDDMSEEEKQ